MNEFYIQLQIVLIYRW